MKKVPLFEGTAAGGLEDTVISELKDDKKLEVEFNEGDNYPWRVTNKKTTSEVFIKFSAGKIWAVVQGMKRDIHLDEIGTTAADVVGVLKVLNNKWFKENDPDYID